MAERLTATECAELIALSAVLQCPCDWQCGRFATHVIPGAAPLCDDCTRQSEERWLSQGGISPERRELPQAKLARRFDRLLRGE